MVQFHPRLPSRWSDGPPVDGADGSDRADRTLDVVGPPIEPPDNTGPSGESKPADSPIEIYRHSSAHLLAAAVTELHPEAQCGIGPPTEDGFFYDFLVAQAVHARGPRGHREADGAHRQAEPAHREEADPEGRGPGALRVEGPDPEVRAHPARRPATSSSATRWASSSTSAWARTCPRPGRSRRSRSCRPRGSLLEGQGGQPGDAAHLRVRPSSRRKSSTRTCSGSKRPSGATIGKLGRELDLFSIADETGAGLILWHPKGGFIRKKIEDFWRDQHLAGGYDLVYSARTSRRSTSGTPAATPSTTRPTCTRPSTSRASSTS